MNFKNKKFLITLIILIILACLLWLVFDKKSVDYPVDNTPFVNEEGQLIITTSNFPVYDFAKNVGGDKVVVSLILPPGAESHAYRPTPSDLETIKNSAIFFYTSALMESWAPSLTKSVTPKTKVLAVADNLNDESFDPHVWLDFAKAQVMVDNIAAAYSLLNPENTQYYQQNALEYKQKLSELDNKYVAGLKDCDFKEFISSGHFTFGYLASRYNLKYQATQGFVPDDSLNTDKVLRLSRELKDSGQPYVYYEELLMPHTGELMRQASGANLMPLNAAHNVGAYDIQSGITFLGLMESDLLILKKGLLCR